MNYSQTSLGAQEEVYSKYTVQSCVVIISQLREATGYLIAGIALSTSSNTNTDTIFAIIRTPVECIVIAIQLIHSRVVEFQYTTAVVRLEHP